MTPGGDVSGCDPTDPRVERSRRVILDATLDELGEVGYGAMTIESIAKRAGVGKATIYRHWNGKLDLVESALDAMKDHLPTPGEGNARDRLIELLRSLVAYLTAPPASECLPTIVSAAHYDPAVRAFHLRFSAERRAVVVDIVEQGRRNGEVGGDVDAELAVEMLVGPIFYRSLMTDRRFTVDEVEPLVDAALRATGAKMHP